MCCCEELGATKKLKKTPTASHETLSGRASEVVYSAVLLPAAAEGCRHRPSYHGQGVTPVRARGVSAQRKPKVPKVGKRFDGARGMVPPALGEMFS